MTKDIIFTEQPLKIYNDEGLHKLLDTILVNLINQRNSQLDAIQLKFR